MLFRLLLDQNKVCWISVSEKPHSFLLVGLKIHLAPKIRFLHMFLKIVIVLLMLQLENGDVIFRNCDGLNVTDRTKYSATGLKMNLT